MKQGEKYKEMTTAREAELLQKNEELASQNRNLSNKVIHLEEQLNWLKRQVFGAKSERFIPTEQPKHPELDLFPDEDKGIDNQNSSEKDKDDTQTVSYERKKKNKKPVRKAFPSHLRREVEVISIENLPDGSVKIGEEETEILEYKAPEFYVRQIRRERYVVKKQEDAVMDNETTVVCAEMPSLPFPRCLYGASLVAYLMVSKYVDHLPFYRQRKIFKRHDVDLSESTINDCFTRTCFLLEPLYDELEKQILKQSYIQADESTIDVLTKDKPGSSHKGYFWAYHSPPKKLALFKYEKGRAGKYPGEFLSGFTGILQTDGYAAYNQFAQNKDITMAACMAHVRRKFVEASDNYPHITDFVLKKIQLLYKVERTIKEQQLTAQEILALRAKVAAPALEEMVQYLRTRQEEVVPQSSIGKAITYFFNQLDRLKTYLSRPKVQIDNNLIENSIRPIALGRKNYLFAGSHDAAQRAAMMYSFFACCHLNNVQPLAWLTDVLNRISDHKANKLKELLPGNWKPLGN